MRKIVIIGNGIAGITCARHIRKKVNDHITIISGETDHFFSRTALMYIYMGHMKYEHTKPYEDFFWSKNKLELIKDFVVAIDTKQKQLHTKDNRNISYDILIIASGSITKKYDWPGQDLKGVISLYSYPDLEEMERQTFGIKNAVIVGGGLIGVEMAEMLHSRGIQVTMLVKEKYYWSSALPQTDAKLIGDHITSHGIKMLYNTELKEIDGDGSGKVSSITTSAGKKIDCPVIGITTGVKPNISFLKNSGIEIDKGVLVNKYFETNIENVYAIGDCAQFKESINGRKEIEQIWYTGRMHAETLAHGLQDSAARGSRRTERRSEDQGVQVRLRRELGAVARDAGLPAGRDIGPGLAGRGHQHRSRRRANLLRVRRLAQRHPRQPQPRLRHEGLALPVPQEAHRP